MSVKECLRELVLFLSLEKRKLRGILLLSSPTSWEVIGKMEKAMVTSCNKGSSA